MRIGIFGGSFNPVHAGHLKLAHEACSTLNLERVFFVPTNQTPLKSRVKLLPARLRLARLRAAVKNFPLFSVSDCEIKRKGFSYTVDTLKFFKRRFARRAALYFLCGADTLENLSRWKSLEEIFRLCRFVVLSRPGAKIKKMPGEVLFLPFDAIDISSTRIRTEWATKKGDFFHRFS